MLVTIRDPHILQNLDPETIRCYLQRHHWQEQEHPGNGVSLWRLRNDDESSLEILLPLQVEFSDFARRMYELLETLEVAENRSQLDILVDLIARWPDTTIQGMVTHLSEGVVAGKVTLMGAIAGKLCRIQLELPEPIYELALQAYRARLPVLCQGDLVKHNRYGFKLENLQHFTLDLEIWNQPLNGEVAQAMGSPQQA